MQALACRAVGAALAGLLFAAPASAGIISSTGAITVLLSPPASVSDGALESDTEIFVFAEQVDVTLGAPLSAVLAVANLAFAGDALPAAGTVLSGTVVNSYFFHADKVIESGSVTVSGTVTFEEDIVAVVARTANLLASDAPVGASGTAYGSAALRGLENADDLISISSDLRTIDIQFFHGSVEDHVRVLTSAAVPEPATALLLGLGLAALAAATRRSRRSW